MESGKPSITFTLDLEDRFESYDGRSRYRDNTLRILDFLENIGVKGTIFTVAGVAEATPDLVSDIASRGHEVACHGYRHRSLDRESLSRFTAEMARAKEVLEQCAGLAVQGFRAPYFSLIPGTRWTVEVLLALGFTYSSSIVPGSNPYFSFLEAPTRPFRWAEGLIELPCPVARIGPVSFPYMGGIYLRYLPATLIERFIRRAGVDEVLWTYVHPYDFDPEAPYARFPGVSGLASLLLWLNRGRTFDKVRRLMDGGSGATLAEIVAGDDFKRSLPVFDRSAPSAIS